ERFPALRCKLLRAQILATGLLDLGKISLARLAGPCDPQHARAGHDLAREMSAIQRRQELAQGKITGRTKEQQVERRILGLAARLEFLHAGKAPQKILVS